MFLIGFLTAVTLCAQTRDAKIAQRVDALRPTLIETRRDFHMYPELSNREERTARVIGEKLRKLGFDEVRTGVARHGIVAVLKGAKPGPAVAWRTDMDGLPVNEIAHRLGLSAKAAESLLTRARDAFKARFRNGPRAIDPVEPTP